MRKLVLAVLVSSAFMGLAVPGFTGPPASYDSVVEGKADPACDVKAIQDAVDKGGTVILKGTFDFGTKGNVNIKNDVELIGETNTQEVPLTKITGGFWTFNSRLPSKESPPDIPGPKIVIQGIHFDGAVWTPLHFAYTSGAEVSGNKITNVMPNPVPLKLKSGETLLWQAGAVFGTRLVTKTKLMPGAVTGNVIFENNEVDLTNDKPQATLGQGVWTVMTWGATIQIRGNVFTNVSRNAIESLDNYLDKEGRGMVIIKDNKVITPTVGVLFPSPNTPNGIVTGWLVDPSGGIDPARYSAILIMGNFVEARGDTSVGIMILSDGAVIRSNDILLGGGSKAVGILQLGFKGLLANNKVHGSGQCALFARPHKIFTASGNTLVANNISACQTSMAHAVLQGNNNMLVGACGKVIDKGTGNKRLE
jgi:hypothetical protein